MSASVKFILHNEKNDQADIELKYLCEDGKYYRASMRQRIKISNWDSEKERVKPGAKDAGSINDLLSSKEKRLYDTIRSLMARSVAITPTVLKNQLKGETKSFWEFYDWLIKNPPPTWGHYALRDYKKLGRLDSSILKRFEKKYGEITFQSINQTLADRLTIFMRTVKYGDSKAGEPLFYNDNTIQCTFRKLRGMVGYAMKYNVIESFEKFTTPARGIDAGAVYLNNDEIKLGYETGNNLPAGTKSRKEINRYSDFHVLGTQIGSRIGYLDIGPENKIEKKGKLYLDLSTNKNPVPIIIPLSSLAIEILDKYNWRIRNVNDVIMNRHIKTVYKIAGLNEKIIHRAIEGSEKGAQLIERQYFKWQLVSSHTMRRSFCTNMMKAGAPVLMIMKISGHKTMSSFMRYIRVDSQEAAELLGGYLT